MELESWKTIIINEQKTNYEISSFGRARNVNRLLYKNKGILKSKFNKQNGYYQVILHINNKKYYRYIHRLVAKAFILNINNVSEVNHKDGNKINNYVNNLEWVTPKENMKHAFDNILVKGTQKPVLIYTLDGKFVQEYPSISEAIRQINPNKTYKTLGLNKEALFNPKYQQYGYQWRLKNSTIPVYNIENNYHGTKGVIQLNLQYQYITEYNSIAQACRALNILNNGEINKVCKNKQKTSHGYIWQYKKDYYK